jgi:hypothetical protein
VVAPFVFAKFELDRITGFHPGLELCSVQEYAFRHFRTIDEAVAFVPIKVCNGANQEVAIILRPCSGGFGPQAQPAFDFFYNACHTSGAFGETVTCGGNFGIRQNLICLNVSSSCRFLALGHKGKTIGIIFRITNTALGVQRPGEDLPAIIGGHIFRMPKPLMWSQLIQ